MYTALHALKDKWDKMQKVYKSTTNLLVHGLPHTPSTKFFQ